MPAKLYPVNLETLTLTRDGRSANIDFYRADRANQDAIYVEVLIDGLERITRADGTKTMKARPVPIYRITIHRRGATKWIATRFSYTPDARPDDGHLNDELVTRLVRERLAR